MKKTIRIISIVLVLALVLGLCGCGKGDDNTELQFASADVTTTGATSSYADPSDDILVSVTPSQDESQQGDGQTDQENTNESESPKVTVCAPVQPGVYAVGGTCPLDTEYIFVNGSYAKETKIVPFKGETSAYFMGRVEITDMTLLEIQSKQPGKELSKKVVFQAFYNEAHQNMQTSSDYDAYLGLDSQMHFYSALLTYSLSGVVDSGMRQTAKSNISTTVNNAKAVNAEVIYLVVPSSASVYPETVPSEYKEASGESIYEAFNSIATECGATVLYPLNTMKAHKNDGEGYKIYSKTDSHWTTYGAYWGVSELMNHISAKYPSAKPRTVSEMQFYTAELYGGDSLFSFKDYNGFEVYSDVTKNGGQTLVTKINELVTLYNLKMPTDTLSQITRNKKSIYLTKDNQNAKRETNSADSSLPTALIVRDSFARTAYDMINDRFSVVDWLSEGDYTSVQDEIKNKKPNYVIYIVSERNLLKVMLNNKDIQLVNVK